MSQEIKFQIGKNGITEGTIQGLNELLKLHKNIRISVFKSSGRDRNSIQEMAKSLQDKLELPIIFKIIGFTIIIRRKSLVPKRNKA